MAQEAECKHRLKQQFCALCNPAEPQTERQPGVRGEPATTPPGLAAAHLDSHYCPALDDQQIDGVQCWAKTRDPETNAKYCTKTQCSSLWRVCFWCLTHGTVSQASRVVDHKQGMCRFHTQDANKGTGKSATKRINPFEGRDQLASYLDRADLAGFLNAVGGDVAKIARMIRRKTMREGMTIDEIAEERMVPSGWVETISLLFKLHPEVMRMVMQGELAPSVVSSLAHLPTKRQQLESASATVASRLDGRTANKFTQKGTGRKVIPLQPLRSSAGQEPLRPAMPGAGQTGPERKEGKPVSNAKDARLALAKEVKKLQDSGMSVKDIAKRHKRHITWAYGLLRLIRDGTPAGQRAQPGARQGRRRSESAAGPRTASGNTHEFGERRVQAAQEKIRTGFRELAQVAAELKTQDRLVRRAMAEAKKAIAGLSPIKPSRKN